MNAPKKAKAFKSGNSVALRLPKSLGVQPGMEMIIREEGGRYILEPVEPPRRIDLSGVYGSMPGLRPRTSEERELEERELDWDGKLLKRG